MSRRSQYDHLKPEIFELFKNGCSPAEVRKQYPAIASSTIYTWASEFRKAAGICRNNSGNSPMADSSTANPPLEPAYLCPADCITPLDEIRQVKREIWKHARRPNRDSAIAIQGFNAYLRAMQVEYSLPPSEDLEMPTEQRVERIAQAIEQLHTRQC